MTPIDIQYRLKKKGIQQKHLAERLGVADMSISKVIHRKMVSDRLMRAVAEAVGRDHREVFPEYYLAPPKRSTSRVELAT